MSAGTPLRVLTVTNMYPTPSLPMSGIPVAEQVASLRKRGLAVDVLFINGVEEGNRAYWDGFGRVRDAVRGGDYDLIHAHYVFSGITAFGQSLPPRRGRALPVVLTQHGIETQRGWTAPVCKWTSRRVTRTIATSAACARRAGLARRRRDSMRRRHGSLLSGARFGGPARACVSARRFARSLCGDAAAGEAAGSDRGRRT